MAIETIILYVVTLFMLVGVFIGEGGIETTFQEAGPMLGAKIEKHIETGSGFTAASKNAESPVDWTRRRGGGGYKVEGLGN